MTPSARWILAAGLVLGPLPAVAGTLTSIANIVDHRDAYANQQVTVVGTVVAPSLSYLGEGLYTLSEADRRIGVVSQTPAPAVGERLEVSAKVGRKPPDEEFDFPPVLIESARRPAN